jgi:mono/diheme cytochrome c family protein
MRRWVGLAGAALWIACSRGEEVGLSAEAERGRVVYLSVCVACHNADPTRDGAVGPANAGASRELLEAKLLRGTYPAGYAPKRSSSVMPRFESLAGDLDALAAYLAWAANGPPPTQPGAARSPER